jgi:hypothetical protein
MPRDSQTLALIIWKKTRLNRGEVNIRKPKANSKKVWSGDVIARRGQCISHSGYHDDENPLCSVVSFKCAVMPNGAFDHAGMHRRTDKMKTKRKISMLREVLKNK